MLTSLTIERQTLALTLLVTSVLADNPDGAFSLENLAVSADLLYGCANFHDDIS
jgi:hypothetical protein